LLPSASSFHSHFLIYHYLNKKIVVKSQMEKSFTDGMSWDNWGEWEIDHIIPLNKGGKHEVKNLQALWKSENRAKGDKII